MNYTGVPKVELHLHLDCSLSYDVVRRIVPETSFEDYKKFFIAPQKCHDLADYISRATKSIELMQTPEQLRWVTLDLFEQLRADHVIYAEIRFAPLQHLMRGLTPDAIVQAINDAVEEGVKTTGIEAGIILCTLRHYSESQSMETVQLVKTFKGSRVVGFDIAADEAGFPIDNHIKAFQFAKAHAIPCTAHAGEARGAESVWETLHNLHPLRIGHGVRSIEDPALLDMLKQKNIHLEVCPTSNIQTTVFDTIEDHAADALYNSGVSLSINTDGRALSNVTLSHEYNLLHTTFQWDKAHFKKCNLDAIDHAFITPKIKAKLRKKIEQGYG